MSVSATPTRTEAERGGARGGSAAIPRNRRVPGNRRKSPGDFPGNRSRASRFPGAHGQQRSGCTRSDSDKAPRSRARESKGVPAESDLMRADKDRAA
jgi:hypothetical protein